ncbi:MAG TPA: HdeD family acid-resistance protein [Bryobacteraceae bacterium]|nr:HdeD family acid-resistance protein [Bryobacteraceae bacterium]
MLGPEMVRAVARHWWVLLLRSIVAVLFAGMALFLPGLTLVSLVLLCGIYFVIDGVMALVVGGRARAWGLLIAGVIGVIAGIVTFMYPGLTAVALVILLAAWAIARGVFEIMAGIRLRREMTHEWLLVVSGALSILFGVLLLINPAAGALAMVWLIGAYALAFGIIMFFAAFRLRRFRTAAA